MASSNPERRIFPVGGTGGASDVPSSYTRDKGKKDEKKDEAKKKWLKLGVLWKQDMAITSEKLYERGVKISPKDSKDYFDKRESHQAMKRNEADGWAEWVMLEGSDRQGLAKSRTGFNKWFGDHVDAYMPNKVDDVLRYTDAILMFQDRMKENIAYPITIDTTTSQDSMMGKLAVIMAKFRTSPEKVYWMDTNADEAGNVYEDPKEGLVQAQNLAVLMPAQLMDIFMDEKAGSEAREKRLRELGPFVMCQILSELEALGLGTAGQGVPNDMITGWFRDSARMTREDLLKALNKKSGTDPRARILAGVLPTVWESSDDMGEMNDALRDMLPEFAQNWEPLPRVAKAASEEAA